MKKSPILSAVLIGLAAGGLTVGISYAWTIDWPLPPELSNLAIFGAIVGTLVGRCAYMALEPRPETEVAEARR